MIKFNYDPILGLTSWFFPKRGDLKIPKPTTRIKNRKKRKK